MWPDDFSVYDSDQRSVAIYKEYRQWHDLLAFKFGIDLPIEPGLDLEPVKINFNPAQFYKELTKDAFEVLSRKPVNNWFPRPMGEDAKGSVDDEKEWAIVEESL